jgi:hypothetical protein
MDACIVGSRISSRIDARGPRRRYGPLRHSDRREKVGRDHARPLCEERKSREGLVRDWSELQLESQILKSSNHARDRVSNINLAPVTRTRIQLFNSDGESKSTSTSRVASQTLSKAGLNAGHGMEGLKTGFDALLKVYGRKTKEGSTFENCKQFKS